MAKKKTWAKVVVKEVGLLDLGETYRGINKAPFEEKIGLVVQLDDMIANLKILSENLNSSITESDYDSIMKDFKDRGLLTYEDDIIIQVGEKYNVTLSKKDGKKIVVSKAIKDVLGVLPDSYKEVKVSANEKAIAEDYAMGKLPKILAPYVSSEEVKELKLKRSKIKTE